MRIPGSSKPLDYFFLIRPTLLVPVWTLLLIGYYRGLTFCSESPARFGVSPRFVHVFLLYSALMGGVYILNQMVDRETDRRNEKLFLLSAGIVPIRLAVLEMFLLFSAPLLLSLLLGVSYFLLMVISLVMGVLYSAPPFRAKGRPIADLLFNALGYGMVNFLMGWMAAGPLDRAAFAHAVPYCFAVGGVFASTTIPDIKGDRADGAITTGVFLGEVRTATLGLALIVLAALFSVLMRDIICLVAALVAVPFFTLAVLKRTRRWYLWSFRMGAPTLVVAAVVLYPHYLILLLLTLASMRIYYRRRFDLAYPSIADER
ncbi:MAG: UbiA family prenyltransferase [bacterium]